MALAQPIPIDVEKKMKTIFTILGEIHHCLQQLTAFREKYSLSQPSRTTQPNPMVLDNPGSLVTIAISSEGGGSLQLEQTSRLATAVSIMSSSRRRLSKAVNFFRKVNFAWSITDDTSNKDKIALLIQSLKYFNDSLRKFMPHMARNLTDRVVNLRTLALSDIPADLRSIGATAHSLRGQVYEDIYSTTMLKARRADVAMLNLTEQEIGRTQIDKRTIAGQVNFLKGIANRIEP
ncbi:hypothetical protein FGG08_006369 [Glutinoglossum americanum]|uniref:Prion-inhibition and propagation HeLo domain-containing protein n=1 Tax=Glutinoglossum americanum TaxID=1670608 RepID=A0A9P8I5F6_9PEZI|nr:hypothetical protein FGG08_006369 [Glutinoglossum americanum]